MNRLVYFLMVGLALTVLQVSTVAAQAPGAPVLTIGDPACQTPPAIGCPAGSPGLMGDPNMPPPTMAPPMGDPNMPPTMAPPMGDPSGMPPMGDPNMPPPTGMSSLGDHCGAIQAKNEKKKMRKEVKCLRRALHEHKPTVKLRQTKDGLGAYGCGVKKTGSKTAQIACLRSLLDGPGGKPGMAPGTN